MSSYQVDSVAFIKQGITRNKDLIPHEEVLRLAFLVQDGLDVIEGLGLPRRYNQEAAIALRDNCIFKRGLESRNKLVVGNMRFAMKKAYYFAKGANARDQASFADFVQAANTRLPFAVERYDPKKGYHITTFLAFYIREAVFFERKKACMSSFKVSLPLLQVKATIASKIEKLTMALGREPTLEDLAIAYKMSIASIKKAIGIPSEISIHSYKLSSESASTAPLMLLDELESQLIERDASMSLYESLVDEYGEPGYHLFQQFLYSDLFNKIKQGVALTDEELETAKKLVKLLKL